MYANRLRFNQKLDLNPLICTLLTRNQLYDIKGGVYTVIYGKVGKNVAGFMLCTLIGYDSAKN